MVVKIKEKKAKYKEMSCLELLNTIESLKKELFTVKQNVKKATHKENSDIKKMKKEIAMVMTFINQKGGMTVALEEKKAAPKSSKKVADIEKTEEKKVTKKTTKKVAKKATKKTTKKTTKKATGKKVDKK